MYRIKIIILLLCLLVIFLQDLRYRKIHVVLPFATFALCFMLTFLVRKITFLEIAVNAAFFLLILSILVIYMSIKNKEFLNPFQSYFGVGDLLFYLAVTPLFLLREYMFFFVFSLFFAIVLQLMFQKKMHEKTVPLAGFSALFLILVIVKDFAFHFEKITLL